MGGWSRDLGTVTTDEIAGVAKVFTEGLARDGHKPAEVALLAKAVAMAKAGVEQLGGRAHVWMGASARPSSREDPSLYDDSVGGHQPSQTSISVTVSLVGDEHVTPSVEAPVVAVGLQV